MRPTQTLRLLAVAAAALALAACSSRPAVRTAATPSTAAPSGSASRTASPTKSPTKAAIGPDSPLSGLPTRRGSAVLAVKIDNTAPARPQVGLNSADIVYVEQVEGGLTRLLAVFHSRLPPAIGPVRSVRTDNVELLAEYGPVAFAFSGGQPAAVSVVAASPLVDDSFDAQPGAYTRAPGRPQPYDLLLDPRAVLAARKGAGARDIGLRFDAASTGPAAHAGGVAVSFPAARLAFRYDRSSRSYAVLEDGTVARDSDGRILGTENVIVQHVQQVVTGLTDINGNATPANLTTGSGAATIYRDGAVLSTTWSRASPAAPTRFKGTRTKKDVPLRPGTTWIVLLPPDASSASTPAR